MRKDLVPFWTKCFNQKIIKLKATKTNPLACHAQNIEGEATWSIEDEGFSSHTVLGYFKPT